MDVWKKNKKNSPKFCLLCLKVPYWTNHNFFFCKIIIFFYLTMKNAFFTLSRLLTQKDADVKKNVFCMWSSFKSTCILILMESFLVCSIGHLETKYKKIGKIIYYFFKHPWKSIWYQFKIFFFTKMHWYCQEKVIYSITHLKISVS